MSDKKLSEAAKAFVSEAHVLMRGTRSGVWSTGSDIAISVVEKLGRLFDQHVAMLVQAERKACAEMARLHEPFYSGECDCSREISSAIRARRS